MGQHISLLDEETQSRRPEETKETEEAPSHSTDDPKNKNGSDETTVQTDDSTKDHNSHDANDEDRDFEFQPSSDDESEDQEEGEVEVELDDHRRVFDWDDIRKVEEQVESSPHIEALELYPPVLKGGNLSPDAFGHTVDEICQEIQDACKGFRKDERNKYTRVLTALGNMKSPEMRCTVPIRYQDRHGKTLKELIASVAGNRSFGRALQFIAMDQATAECEMIHKACQGYRTNAMVLLTIVCGRRNDEMTVLKRKYFTLYAEELSTVLHSKLGGDTELLVVDHCLKASEEDYTTEVHTESKCTEDVADLYQNMGQHPRLFEILCSMPPQHMKSVNMAFAEKYGYTLFTAVEKELRGKVRDAALLLIGSKIRPFQTVAGLIDKACKGFGTNKFLLTTVFIRYYPYMKQIVEVHDEMYETKLLERLQNQVHGNYERLLETILRAGMED